MSVAENTSYLEASGQNEYSFLEGGWISKWLDSHLLSGELIGKYIWVLELFKRNEISAEQCNKLIENLDKIMSEYLWRMENGKILGGDIHGCAVEAIKDCLWKEEWSNISSKMVTLSHRNEWMSHDLALSQKQIGADLLQSMLAFWNELLNTVRETKDLPIQSLTHVKKATALSTVGHQLAQYLFFVQKIADHIFLITHHIQGTIWSKNWASEVDALHVKYNYLSWVETQQHTDLWLWGRAFTSAQFWEQIDHIATCFRQIGNYLQFAHDENYFTFDENYGVSPDVHTSRLKLEWIESHMWRDINILKGYTSSLKYTFESQVYPWYNSAESASKVILIKAVYTLVHLMKETSEILTSVQWTNLKSAQEAVSDIPFLFGDELIWFLKSEGRLWVAEAEKVVAKMKVLCLWQGKKKYNYESFTSVAKELVIDVDHISKEDFQNWLDPAYILSAKSTLGAPGAMDDMIIHLEKGVKNIHDMLDVLKQEKEKNLDIWVDRLKEYLWEKKSQIKIDLLKEKIIFLLW